MEIEKNCPYGQKEEENNGSQKQFSPTLFGILDKKETKIKKNEKKRRKKNEKEGKKKVSGQIGFYRSKKEKRRKETRESGRKKARRQKEKTPTEERVRYKLGPNANSISIPAPSHAKDDAPKQTPTLHVEVEKLKNAWLLLHDHLMSLWNNTPTTTEPDIQAAPNPPAPLPSDADADADSGIGDCWLRGLNWKDDDIRDDAPL